MQHRGLLGPVLVILFLVGLLLGWHLRSTSTTNTANQTVEPPSSGADTANVVDRSVNASNVNTTPAVNVNRSSATLAPTASIVLPIADFFARVTKKPFGIYITPATSPIQPEKFTGYHTGADAETTAAEAQLDVPIFSIATGTVVFAGHVNGYGGVIIIRHTIDGVKLLSLYGHLRIASFTVKDNDTVKPGQQITVLGMGYSSETDGERKHLHFGLIKGTAITYRGYVSSSSQLSAWYDPVAFLHSQGL